MGIKVSTKTKATETLKLYNHLNSYLFEQEYDELKDISANCLKALKSAQRALGIIINKASK